jgi:hypothetical protein
MIEISSVSFYKGIVEIEVLDISDIQLQRMQERCREDESRVVMYRFDLHKQEDYKYLGYWLKKATKRIPAYEKTTWNDVLTIILGRIYIQGFSSKYRV